MIKKLHIVHTESSCGWGGQEIRTLTEAAGMIERGHCVTLLCPGEAQIHAAARERGIPVVAVPIAKKRLPGLVALHRWLRTHPDTSVINTHSSTDSWLTALACVGLHGAPSIVRTRHVSSHIKNNLSTRWLYLNATRHIVTTGEAVRQQLHHENNFPLECMTSVPTGIDLIRYSPGDKRQACVALGLPQEKLYLGIVSTLRNWKGHVYLFEALVRLRLTHPGLLLLVVGDGPQRHNLEKLVLKLGLSNCVEMVGNRDDVPLWLRAFDLFVLPSYGEEGVPQAIMQAMAASLAVVSTTVGAIGEAVVDGETGLLVAPRDGEALTAALDQLLRDTLLRQRMAAAAYQRAQSLFGSDIMLDKMQAIFHAAARG